MSRVNGTAFDRPTAGNQLSGGGQNLSECVNNAGDHLVQLVAKSNQILQYLEPTPVAGEAISNGPPNGIRNRANKLVDMTEQLNRNLGMIMRLLGVPEKE